MLHPVERLRRAKGLSQKALGAALGLHYTTVGGWERMSSQPTAKMIPRLAEVLGTDAEQLAIELDAAFVANRALQKVRRRRTKRREAAAA